MIFVGTDIVDIYRIRKIINEKGERFISRIYDDIEISYCSSQLDPSVHYAGRFSAKEAIKKALLSSGIFNSIQLKNIVIQRNQMGAPKVILPVEILDKGSISVSISHSNTSATATAIFETC